ncbi:MAG: Flp family type IVb pilin [Chloroflexi bacterium]|nr:Flp family type IVb pilin [Chloroflexota bacterium]
MDLSERTTVSRTEGGYPLQELVDYLAARIIRPDSKGQGLAEYALILALIAIVVIASVVFLGGQMNTIMSRVGKSI